VLKADTFSPVNQPSRLTSDAELYTGSVTRLASLFYDNLSELGRFEPVTASEMPAPYRGLLAHSEHMTVTLESAGRSLIDVRVLSEWRDGSSYARNSVLTRQSDGAVLQFGIMRIWLGDLPPLARDEITIQRIPLGRVLIKHKVLREVELIALWRIEPGPVLRQQLQLAAGQTLYGRSAQILVDERPTVQLLEILAPAS
jgi:chorismate-pyruvate lyase